ncbi:hypothetical protein ACLB2K_022575 [Fragaria x ananassa]
MANPNFTQTALFVALLQTLVSRIPLRPIWPLPNFGFNLLQFPCFSQKTQISKDFWFENEIEEEEEEVEEVVDDEDADNAIDVKNSDDLKVFCEAVGEVTQVQIMKGKDLGDGKGFAFVTFRNMEMASTAIDELNNTEFKDMKNTSNNRGFAFIDYYNHAYAVFSRQKMFCSQPQDLSKAIKPCRRRLQVVMFNLAPPLGSFSTEATLLEEGPANDDSASFRALVTVRGDKFLFMDGPAPKRAEEELADVTFGDLQKARSNGSHVLLPPQPKDDKKKAAGANKNWPMEVSSKKPVSRFREVIRAPKKGSGKLEQRRKKNASKDHRYMPYRRPDNIE